MADSQTQRSLASLLALLPIQTDKEIGEQDIRDLVETLRPNIGQIYITAAGVVTITDTVSYFDANGTFALSTASENFDLQTTGRLRYIGIAPRKVAVDCSFSYSVAGANQLLHFRLALNGTPLADSEITRDVGSSGDQGSSPLVGAIMMSNGDFVTLEVRNESSTADVTFEHLTLRGIAHVT